MPSTYPLAIPAGYERPHFIGIGGAGMSAIARILLQRGGRVSGSDAADSVSLRALRFEGADVHVGTRAEHVPRDASCVIVSSAIRPDNPELAQAARLGVPRMHRSVALAALLGDHQSVIVTGTHGKTTTASMVAAALRDIGLDPSYALGGFPAGPTSNAHHGKGRLFVAEGDESDRSFHAYTPDVAVILNIELEHHDTYESLDDVHAAFDVFAARVPADRTLVLNADHDGTRALARRVAQRTDSPRLLTYGAGDDADVRILDITAQGLSSVVTVLIDGREIGFSVSVPGHHYAHDAVAALTTALAAGIQPEQFAPALGLFAGVHRRLETVGEVNGVRVVDTYAHHPTEMAADIQALRAAAPGSDLLVVYQPHSYSRVVHQGTAMGAALADADCSIVVDIYGGREDPVAGVSSEQVVAAAHAAGAASVYVPDMWKVPALIPDGVRSGDVVVTMGGGTIGRIAPLVVKALQAQRG
ncbi:UDP-N-acetylmuramate--L-alanine ligase [Streptomyces sp. NPDC020800]|uniref:UDP-N-acetylmuramate--L-alanine ligase n=1 Tax=Streptomyces sp. NPDC020800 TaxID=3365092 RepID=UPI0037B26EE3